MPADFPRPVRRPSETFDRLFAGTDPAEAVRLAHATAIALLDRVRRSPDPEIVDRLIAFTHDHGIVDIAELWSQAPPVSLPGALWRLYLLQTSIHQHPQEVAALFERGVGMLSTADPVIAGAPQPAAPDELVSVIDTIMRGAFTGDFATALDRAAAFARVEASGALTLADDHDHTEPERAAALTTRAARLSGIAGELSDAARQWRRDALA